jgi:two-component system, LytTR family, sensor kinase
MQTLTPKRFWGITYREWLGVAIMYFVSLVLYDLSISISERGFSQDRSLFQIFLSYLPQNTLFYAIKILFTVPLWWLFFRKLVGWSLTQKVALHFLVAPVYLYVTIAISYAIADYFQIGRLRGYGSIWDIYIGLLLYLLQFGIFHAYSYHKYLQRQQKLESELRELALNSELSALKAQINPHFLYNTFNTISASVPPELEHTRELLAQLADLFRYQLQASKSELAMVSEELDFVKKYLELEQARFEDRLRVSFDVAEEVLDKKMPPMLLQPLVENAVKHGIAPLIEGGDIGLKISLENGFLHFEVSDTGVGYANIPTLESTTSANGVGLANTRLRLSKMFGQDISFSENQPRGLRLTFKIPVSQPLHEKSNHH